jgi:hypothetical protein
MIADKESVFILFYRVATFFKVLYPLVRSRS